MNKRFLLFSLTILSWVALTGVNHKFYVSITQVDVNKDSHKLEVSARIFSDDLEATILGESGQKLALGTEKEHPKADSILFSYMVSTLEFKQQGKNQELILIGKEVEADVTWIYLETRESISLTQPLEIRNGILQERFPDQKNIVNFKIGSQVSSQIHTKGHQTFTYLIDSKE